MPGFNPQLLLDTPRYPDHGYAPLADRLKRLLATSADLVFVESFARCAQA